MIKKLLTPLLIVLPTRLLAETSEEPISSVSELSVLQVLLPLLMVVTLIFILAWLVKRFNPGLPKIGKDIELLSSIPLTNQSRLSLVRVGGKDLLIGITPQSISLLKDFDEAIVDKSIPAQADLSEQFKRLLRAKPAKKPEQTNEKPNIANHE